MRTSIGIDVAAPPHVVFALARDVTRWSDLLPHYMRSRAAGRTPDGLLVTFVARRDLVRGLGLGIPVAWRSLTWSEPATCRLRFLHRGGATRGMSVTWTIAPVGPDRSRVTIAHDFPAPRAWAWFVDRAFTRPIATRTLATFRALAEATWTSGAPAPANESA